MSINDIIVEIYRKKMILLGKYRLTSGRISPYYINLRILPSYPHLLHKVMEKLVNLTENIEYDVVAGIETSGIVYAAYLGCLTKKPIAYIRKNRKKHGLGGSVEGLVENKHVIIIDDVATTGNTLYRAVETLRRQGAIVRYACVIIDRCEGASEKLSTINVELKRLITIYDIVEVLKEKGYLTGEAEKNILEYLRKQGRSGSSNELS